MNPEIIILVIFLIIISIASIIWFLKLIHQRIEIKIDNTFSNENN
tara:strand:+ start:118 stop:252 length:135 start_codon:yes stop_codon:yes gene_type:complete